MVVGRISHFTPFSLILIFYISQVYFSSINRRARYRNPSSYRHIYIVRGEVEPSDVNAVHFIVASAKAIVARPEASSENYQ